MKTVKTLIQLQLVDGEYRLIREERYEYDGPWSLCDRNTSKKVANQGMAQSAQDQQNAQKALSSTNSELTNYKSNLDNFMKFGRQTYGENGEFMRDQNTIANTTAAAGTNKIGGDLALNAMRTGENTGNYANTLAESTRGASRDLTSQLAGADATRLQNLTNINQYGVQASALPAQVQASLYGTGSGGASSNLNPAADAAKTPGFLDQLTGQLIQGGATVGAAAVKS